MGKFISNSKIDYFLSIGNDMKYAHAIADELMDNAFHFESNKVLIEYLKFLVEPNDVILIKGSRSMKMETIIAELNKE
jgi:UDP-N-acetylmuramoyl-tripeptide--D-alanyl-D-alanine ligase